MERPGFATMASKDIDIVVARSGSRPISKAKILLIDDCEDIHQLVIKAPSDICHIYTANLRLMV
jgi:hypothetical protein